MLWLFKSLFVRQLLGNNYEIHLWSWPFLTRLEREDKNEYNTWLAKNGPRLVTKSVSPLKGHD